MSIIGLLLYWYVLSVLRFLNIVAALISVHGYLIYNIIRIIATGMLTFLMHIVFQGT